MKTIDELTNELIADARRLVALLETSTAAGIGPYDHQADPELHMLTSYCEAVLDGNCDVNPLAHSLVDHELCDRATAERALEKAAEIMARDQSLMRSLVAFRQDSGP
jgi:hypothetical protein